MTPLEIAKNIMDCGDSVIRLSPQQAQCIAAEVIRQDAEIKGLNDWVKEVVEQYDRVKMEKQSAALKAAKSLFRDIRKQGWEWSDEAAEYLKEYGDE